MDSVMGKGNNSVIEMLYQDVSSETIINACEFVYKFSIPEEFPSTNGRKDIGWDGAWSILT